MTVTHPVRGHSGSRMPESRARYGRQEPDPVYRRTNPSGPVSSRPGRENCFLGCKKSWCEKNCFEDCKR